MGRPPVPATAMRRGAPAGPPAWAPSVFSAVSRQVRAHAREGYAGGGAGRRPGGARGGFSGLRFECSRSGRTRPRGRGFARRLLGGATSGASARGGCVHVPPLRPGWPGSAREGFIPQPRAPPHLSMRICAGDFPVPVILLSGARVRARFAFVAVMRAGGWFGPLQESSRPACAPGGAPREEAGRRLRALSRKEIY